MQSVLKTLYKHQHLDRHEAREALAQLVSGQSSETEVASFLTAFIMRQPGAQELMGFKDAMMDSCTRIDLQTADDSVDLVGTGGDGKGTFNISTLSGVVLAACGVPVIKHGNYGSTSVSGSSDVLRHLGYRFSDRQEALQRQLDRTGFCFLHAPMFHPGMGRLSSVRKAMGVRNFLNTLGPLMNPAQPQAMLLGVSSVDQARLYKYLLEQEDRCFTIVHALDGYDEISLTGKTKIITANDEREATPQQLGFECVRPEGLLGGHSIEAAGRIFLNVLMGKGTVTQINVVLA
ncbi:MAG: anthranilate phosphoribosyltransferase, partial [Sphingobacteriales bacterium]